MWAAKLGLWIDADSWWKKTWSFWEMHWADENPNPLRIHAVNATRSTSIIRVVLLKVPITRDVFLLIIWLLIVQQRNQREFEGALVCARALSDIMLLIRHNEAHKWDRTWSSRESMSLIQQTVATLLEWSARPKNRSTAKFSSDSQQGNVATNRPYNEARKLIVVAFPDAQGPMSVDGIQAEAETARLQIRRILSVIHRIGNVLCPVAWVIIS